MLPGAKSIVRASVLLLAIALAFLSFACLALLNRFRVTRAARARWLQSSCARALRWLGIRVVSHGAFPDQGMIAANHLSYLDILVFSSLHPCVFVSKAEVRRWPLFGPLSRWAGTIFVERERRSTSHRSSREIEQVLHSHIPVVLFPEGTSSDGSSVLRFHTTLFDPAVRLEADVTAAHIGYSVAGGNVATDVCYWGEMTLVPHLLKLLSKAKLVATVQFSSHSRIYTDRKQAAAETWQEVMDFRRQTSAVAAGSDVAVL